MGDDPVRARQPLAVVAVVDAPTEDVWVWWVAIDVSPGQDTLSRLCGAWRVARDDAEILEALTHRRIVLPTPSGAAALASAALTDRWILDAGATHKAVSDEVDALQAAFVAEQHARPASKRMVTPQWPDLPPALGLTAPPVPEPGSVPGEQRRALGIARWLARLCGTWSAVEERRLSRTFLRDLRGESPRTLPVVLVPPNPTVPEVR